MKTIITLTIGAALLFAACGNDDGGGSDEPGDFASDVIEQLSNGQFGRAWETMHPAQQEFVDRDFYVECAQGSAPAMELVDVETVEVYEEEATIPGTDTTANATAVTYRAEVTSGGDTQSFTDTTRLFEVEGDWRWAWAGADAARDGQCP